MREIVKLVRSIDPGAVHCGVAMWAQDSDGLWECSQAVEMTPEECVDAIRAEVVHGIVDEVIVEGFWLKGGMGAIVQAGSEMETTEVIGTIRHLCRWHNVPFQKVANGQQSIHTRMKAVGYQYKSHGSGNHAKDAEAVGIRGLGLKVRQIKQVADRRST